MPCMDQTCNLVAAAVYRNKATVRLGPKDPARTSKANEWLSNHVKGNTIKVKDMNLNRNNFSRRVKKSVR